MKTTTLLAALCSAAVPVLAGEPAVAPSPTATASTPAPAPLPTMTPDQLLDQRQRHDESLFVLDVRTPQEFAEGHVPGAVNVPHDQIASRLRDVPRDKDVVLYCRTGRRVGLAAEVLTAQGYTRLWHLDGDIVAWQAQGRPLEK